MIRYVDLGKEAQGTLADFLLQVPSVVASGQFILGEPVLRFEAEFARRQGVRHAIAVNSGLDALFLALLAVGVGPGDEVVTAPNSFVATAAAIAHTGARIVFADVDRYRNLDPSAVRRTLTERTKAIIPVHLTGICSQMEDLAAIAQEAGIAVIEDCAQAVGSTYAGRAVGTLGIAGCFSLHPLKNLSALGDGGCVITDDDTVASSIRSLRNHGLVDRNTTAAWGYNSRLDTVQALWLLSKLSTLDEVLSRRRAIAEAYLTEFTDIHSLELPVIPDNTSASWHAFVVQVSQRDELQQHLLSSGIETLIHYPVPIHLQPAAVGLGYRRGSFPRCEYQAGRILSFPVRSSLSDSEVEQIISAVRSFYKRAGAE